MKLLGDKRRNRSKHFIGSECFMFFRKIITAKKSLLKVGKGRVFIIKCF